MLNTSETPSGVLCPVVVSSTQEIHCHIGTSPMESQRDDWRFITWKERRRKLSLFNLKKTRQPLRGEEKIEPASAPRCTGTGREAVDKKLEQRNSDWIQKENFFLNEDGQNTGTGCSKLLWHLNQWIKNWSVHVTEQPDLIGVSVRGGSD